MTYPTLPFALIHLMAKVTPERASLPANSAHFSIFAHHGRNCRSVRLQATQPADYDVLDMAIETLLAEAPADTIAIFYSTDDADPVDFGVVIEQGKADTILHWHYAPQFLVELDESQAGAALLSKLPGIETARRLIQMPPMPPSSSQCKNLEFKVG